jgi:hypothetical protein
MTNNLPNYIYTLDWTQQDLSLGRQDIGAVSDLALGVDGRNLYAATDQGLWRLPLQDYRASGAGRVASPPPV